MINQLRKALLSEFPDKSPEKNQRFVDWVFDYRGKEIEATIGFLRENEKPMCGIVCGTPDIDYYNDKDNNLPPYGLLWLTNRRLIFVYKTGGGLFKTPDSHFLEYHFSDISSIKSMGKGVIFKESWIVLYLSTSSAIGKVVSVSFNLHGTYHKELAEAFVRNVQQYQKSLRDKATIGKSPANIEDDLIAKLDKLNNFRQDGIISEDEFKVAKMKLLGM